MTREELTSIIAFAIDGEMESYEFYRDAAAKMKDQQLKSTFEGLAKDELEHREFLEGFLESEATTIKIHEHVDYKLSETIEKPPLSVDMGFADAIALAIKKEEDAMLMYQGLADACEEDETKNVFMGLKDMESLHKVRLEEIYLNVGYSEVW